MKRFETVHRPAHDEQELVAVTCDLCERGQTALLHTSWVRDENNREFERTECELSRGVRTGDPGGTATVWSYDMCGACMESRVFPAIQALGGPPHRREVTY